MDGQNNHINKLTMTLFESTEEITYIYIYISLCGIAEAATYRLHTGTILGLQKGNVGQAYRTANTSTHAYLDTEPRNIMKNSDTQWCDQRSSTVHSTPVTLPKAVASSNKKLTVHVFQTLCINWSEHLHVECHVH